MKPSSKTSSRYSAGFHLRTESLWLVQARKACTVMRMRPLTPRSQCAGRGDRGEGKRPFEPMRQSSGPVTQDEAQPTRRPPHGRARRSRHGTRGEDRSKISQQRAVPCIACAPSRAACTPRSAGAAAHQRGPWVRRAAAVGWRGRRRKEIFAFAICGRTNGQR